MSDSRVKDFFYNGNAVHGEPDYGLADNFVRTAEAFATTPHTISSPPSRAIAGSVAVNC